MADEATAPAGEQQAATPTPADLMQRLAGQPTEAPQATEQQPEDDPNAAGGKVRLQADLAAERDKRQQLEQQFGQLRDGLAQALGINQGEQVTPEQLTQQLTEAQSERDGLNARLQVFLNAPDGVDTRALLDSRSFTDTLGGIDLSNPAAVTQAVNDFVDSHPRFRTGPATPPGMRDATAGRSTPQGSISMDDLIRGRR